MCDAFAGSTVIAFTNRFGRFEALTECHVPPAFVSMPAANPAALHGPHQPTYVVLPLTAIAVIEWPGPVSCTIFQSQAEAEQEVFQPLPPLSQTNSPPATQWSRFFTSARNGAMNRGLGSHGLGV